ncbi:MAG: phosphodiester glycosidase family protein [Armatimonadota bacterium]
MRYFWLVVLVAVVVVGIRLAEVGIPGVSASGGGQGSPQCTAAGDWQSSAHGIEVRSFDRTDNGRKYQVTAVRLDTARCAIRVVDAHRGKPNAGALVSTVCPKDGAAINASFFDDNLAPIGLVVADGKQTKAVRKSSGWGVFLLRDGKARILPADGDIPRRVAQAVECKPRLVVDGIIQRFKVQPAAKRSAVGIDAQGRVLLVASLGLFTLEEWAKFLHDDLGCVNALNLDGGPSTQLAVRGKVKEELSGGWPVPVFITAAPRVSR